MKLSRSLLLPLLLGYVYSGYLATTLVALATTTTTVSGLSCQACTEYTGPALNQTTRKPKAGNELPRCDDLDFDFQNCTEDETRCYEIRVRYADNSTILARGCGSAHMTCAPYLGFQELDWCQVTLCPEEGVDNCEVETSAARVAALVAPVVVVLAVLSW